MKKRTGTKALSIALAAALCMTGLAGCGPKTQETQGSTAAKTEAITYRLAITRIR